MNLGLIGCGYVGTKRAKAIGRHRLLAVSDVKRSKAQAFAHTFKTKAVHRWQDVARDPQVDAVIVSTTPDVLVRVALACIQAGKHVLIEKPVARSASELAPLMRAALQKKVIVHTGFNHRFHPAILKAGQLIHQGAIGELLYVRAHYGHGGRRGYEKEWRARRSVAGGGELMDQGTHLIDLAQMFLGPLQVAHGMFKTYFWNMPVEDNAFVALHSQDGKVAWLHASWTEWKNRFVFEIFGRTGKLEINGLGGSYGPEALTFSKMSRRMGPPKIRQWVFKGPDMSWQREFDHFAYAIRKKKVTNALRNAQATLKLVDHLYRRFW